jgi:CheY-like chemotaxis protein/anti-sigma regulatory factor (Ser/Thr protein kinase)
MKIQAEAKEIALQISVGSLRCFVNCDPRKMERVVSNVIQNAVNFTPEGGAVEVILRADEQEPSWVALEVVDNGIGIGAEHLGRVTERYYRVGEHIAGTGLGLALAKELVGLHSGHLEIKSPVPGRSRGTLVSVRLPTVSAPVILIVDDDPVIREMLSKQLGSEGYEVLTCADSESALDVLGQTRPDGMIVDLILPVMGGAQAIAKIKSDEKLRRIPVMAITGGELDQAKHEILEGFGIPTLAKPWKRDELLDRMEELLLGTGYLGR